MSASPLVHGSVAPGFERVRERYAHAAEAEPGLSSQLSVYHRGRQVVDLWTGAEISGESMLAVYSCSKGAAFLVVSLLIQDGLIDPDERVSTYWPELVAARDSSLTVHEFLTHKAGLINTDAGMTFAEVIDDARIARLLEDQQPFWEPGTALGYHALTIGALAGEIARRVSGASLHEIYEQRIRQPHDVDFYLGFPESEESRFLSVQPPSEQPAEGGSVPSLLAISLNWHGAEPLDLYDKPNHRSFRAKGQSSGGGVGSARGLARMYAAAIGVEGHAPLLTAGTVAQIASYRIAETDVISGGDAYFLLGYQDISVRFSGLSSTAFGHDGAAGSLGFADPANELAYGYTRRRFVTNGMGAAPENDGLVDEVLACFQG